MIPFLREIVVAIVWATANVVYVGMRHRGSRSFGRFLAFWTGLPATLISMFVVREPSVPPLQPPPDDEARLLREIRVDRERRGRAIPPSEPADDEPADTTAE